jgi:hypothetical protein
MDADGTGPREVERQADTDVNLPEWSPGGELIAYTVRRSFDVAW